MCVDNGEWQALCEAASKEHDPDKLKMLIAELMKALDERNKSSQPAGLL
jgi:hypothetical protein